MCPVCVANMALLAAGSPHVKRESIPGTGHATPATPQGANRIRDILLAEIERGELRSHGIRPLDAYRSQDDLTVPGLDVEVFRRPDSIGHGLRKRELVFGSDFGEHPFLAFRK